MCSISQIILIISVYKSDIPVEIPFTPNRLEYPEAFPAFATLIGICRLGQSVSFRVV